MNKLSFRLSAISAVILGLMIFSANALGQTDRSASIVPCGENDAPGQPTLKQRQPTPDDSTPKEENITPNSDAKETCRPKGEPEAVKEESKTTIRFEGLANTNETDIRKELREHRVQLPRDPSLEPDLTEKAAAAVRDLLVARGYRHAMVHTHVDQINADSKALTFVVNEGVRPTIAEFRFEGNRIFPTLELAEEIRQCMVGYERDYYDSLVFEYCIRRLDNFVRSHGYLQAHFHDPKVEETTGSLIVTLQADEGILYRLGEIKIEGASAFPVEKIRAMLALQRGDVANGEQLSKALFEELKKVYSEKGYIQYTAEVTPTFRLASDKSGGIVDFEITIDEGKRFTIRKIGFKGDNLPEEQLRQLLLIHDGDIFNQTMFEKSIDKLNDTGLFVSIDKDGDTDFLTNEEEDLVDVVIKLTKRQN